MKKALLSLIFLCTVLTLFGGCKQATHLQIDYADFVQLDGVSYVNADIAVPPEQIGEILGKVKRNPPTEVTNVDAPPATLDGDAARLPIGTVIYAVNGYDSKKYVAAEENGNYLLYKIMQSDDISFAKGEITQ